MWSPVMNFGFTRRVCTNFAPVSSAIEYLVVENYQSWLCCKVCVSFKKWLLSLHCVWFGCLYKALICHSFYMDCDL